MPLSFTEHDVPNSQALEQVGSSTNRCVLDLGGVLYYFCLPRVGTAPFPVTNIFVQKSTDSGATWSTVSPAFTVTPPGSPFAAMASPGGKALILTTDTADPLDRALIYTFDPAVDDFISVSAPGPNNIVMTVGQVNSDGTVLAVGYDNSVSPNPTLAAIYDPGSDTWGATVQVTVPSDNAVPFALLKEVGTDRSYYFYHSDIGAFSRANCTTITCPGLTLGVAQDLTPLLGQLQPDICTIGLPCIRGADSEVVIPIFTEDTGPFPTDITLGLVNVLRSPCGPDVSFSSIQVDSYLNFTPPLFPINFVGEFVFFAAVAEFLGDLYVFYSTSSTIVASDPTEGMLLYAVQPGGVGPWSPIQQLIFDGTPLAVAQVYPVSIGTTAFGLFACFMDPTMYFDDFDPELKYSSLHAKFFFAGAAPPLSMSCGGHSGGTVGNPYSHNYPVSGGTPPYTFAIIAGSLPPGLSLDPSMGIVSGVPILAGVFPFTIQVTDSVPDTASIDCSITIAAGPVVLGSIRITLRGVKLRPICEPEEGAGVVPEISKVPRAL